MYTMYHILVTDHEHYPTQFLIVPYFFFLNVENDIKHFSSSDPT